MKKLFFSTLFLLGMLASSQAQFILDYHFANLSTTTTWTFTLTEANGNTITIPVGPTSSSTNTLTLNAAWPLTWSVVNSQGCSASGTDFNLIGDTPINAPCPIIITPGPVAAGVYKIEQLSPLPARNIFKIGMN